MLLAFLLLLPFLGATAREDPEQHMSTPEMVRFWGYPAEEHWVTTHDGYILGIHRIPGKGPVVFIQHGLLDSSATWVMNDPAQSLGFILADQGYDVWMGNVRGNTYSTNHTSLSIKSKEFWEFSFDQFAAIDLPAMINYVINVTGVETVSYAGHSQGTLIGFIGFSSNPELASKVNVFAALAPVARITHIEGLVRVLNLIEPELENLFKLFGLHDFAPSNWEMKLLASLVCPIDKEVICRNVIFLLAGYDTSNLNNTRIPVYVAHTPAGTSVQNMIHWAQLLREQKLQGYDYGKKGNMAHYNSTTPPQYDPSKISIPTALLAGGNDFLADPRDVAWLEGQLDPDILVLNRFWDKLNHMDFVWGLNAKDIVYGDILKLIAKYNPK